MKKRKGSKRSGRKVWLSLLVSLLFAVGLLLPGDPVVADDPIPTPAPEGFTEWSTVTVTAAEVAPEGIGRPAKGNPKLESSLNQLLEAHRREGLAEVQAFAETHMMVLDDDRVQVVIVTTQEAISGLKEAVEALGGEYQGHYEGLLQALVPMDALESLAQRPDVRVIREPRRPIPLGPAMAGTVDTEGLGPSNASDWHSAGYTGSGVRVAVIDGGFTNYTSRLGTDLPGSVTTYDWTGSGMTGSPHGTACAEVVYDMAYGATMDLHKVGSDVELGNAVTQAIADGVDIISMSLGWILDGPGDGTGNLANIVNNARSNDILYATAAGNNAEHSWSGTYTDADSNDFHEWNASGQEVNYFGPGDGSAWVIPAGFSIVVGLHWDDWTAVDQDYDLELYRWDSSSWVFVAGSYNWQNGVPGQTPEEFIGVLAPNNAPYGVVVRKWDSTRDVCLRLIASHTGYDLDERLPERSVVFPGDSPDAITVGAVDVSTYNLESYSSRGPAFGSGGTCSGGSTKPDIAAYANVSTVSYGPGAFNGTSAATPHVAGAAALVKGVYPSYSVSQLQSFLEGRAIDLGTSGKDNLYGAGRLYLGDPPSPGPIVYDSHLIDDDSTGQSIGNDDGIVDPGETIELFVDLYNQGSDTATSVNACISEGSPYVAGFLYNTCSNYGDIPGGGTTTNSDDFDFEVDSSTPVGHVIPFTLTITASNGGPWSDSFNVTVGEAPEENIYMPIILKNH
jgi:subtilisin family serine protease